MNMTKSLPSFLRVTMLVVVSFLLVSCFNTNIRPTTHLFPVSSLQIDNSLHQTVGLLASDPEAGFNCTGVIISDRYVLTAEHCIDHDVRFLGRTITGPSPLGDMVSVVTYSMFNSTGFTENIQYEVVAADDSLDLALLRRHGNFIGTHSVVELRHENVSRGELLYGIGHPVGITYNVTHGYVSSTSRSLRRLRSSSADRIFSSVQIYYGNSGGPLFDSEGKLVGIASLMIGTPHLNASVYLTSIEAFLREHLGPAYLTMNVPTA